MSNPQIAFDPRSICNLILDFADRHRRPITNLALQKLLYFAHGLHLTERGAPLVTGWFEAWQYGPVHPTAYQAFRSARAEPISFRAKLFDPFTNAEIPIAACPESDAHFRVE